MIVIGPTGDERSLTLKGLKGWRSRFCRERRDRVIDYAIG